MNKNEHIMVRDDLITSLKEQNTILKQQITILYKIIQKISPKTYATIMHTKK
jgi:hypothetical protein